ncbi:Uncharacterized protein Fot_03677 [Forsythia ovata]|uniref:Uncharacterized protein n=1 Tax=Forsythia ovata TaxID=205694 RepID=A0ABD1XDF0_9LAMI
MSQISFINEAFDLDLALTTMKFGKFDHGLNSILPTTTILKNLGNRVAILFLSSKKIDHQKILPIERLDLVKSQTSFACLGVWEVKLLCANMRLPKISPNLGRGSLAEAVPLLDESQLTAYFGR